jgi:hypothetical protein
MSRVARVFLPPKFTQIGIFGLKQTIWQPSSYEQCLQNDEK